MMTETGQQKTVYSAWGMTESRRKFCRRMGFTATLLLFGFWGWATWQDWGIRHLLYFLSLSSLIVVANFDNTFSCVTIDEAEGTLIQGGREKYPIQIAEITSVLIKQSKRGRFRSLFIHDSGVRFMDIRMNKKQCMKILEHLKCLNPRIQEKTADWV